MIIILNGEARNISAETTIAALVESLGMAPRHVAVEVNLELVPRAQHGNHRLLDGDSVEIVTLVGGG